MSAAPLTDRRSLRAQGIVERNEVREVRPGVFEVWDSVTGSGQRHLVSGETCGCIDFRRTGLACKHVLGVRKYQAANWSSRQADDLQGNFLDGPFDAFDDVQLTEPAKGAWYKGVYYTAEQCDAAAAARAADPVCPTCQGPTKEDLLWCGRRAWQRFRVCQANREHKATRI